MAMEYGYGPPTELAKIIIEKRKKGRKKQWLGPGWRAGMLRQLVREGMIFRPGLG